MERQHGAEGLDCNNYFSSINKKKYSIYTNVFFLLRLVNIDCCLMREIEIVEIEKDSNFFNGKLNFS